MRRGTLLRRYEQLIAAACVAAHANASEPGFRQRDVRFLSELFANWISHSVDAEATTLANTQVQRYIEQLVVDGYARVSMRGARPSYRLTRIGLIELLGRLVPGARYVQPEQFAFVYYFIKNYRQRLIAVVETEGKQFPQAVRLEIEALLDYTTLVRAQLRAAELELQKLEQRLQDSEQSGALAARLLKRGEPLSVVAAEIERLHPYELNSLKPLSELMAEIPPDLARWELETGAQRRAADLWVPVKAVLVAHVNSLRKMLQGG
jgi:hypothetical protein